MRMLASSSTVAEAAPLMGLEFLPQRLYSSMWFRNESVFTEIFLNRIKGKQIIFARVHGATTAKKNNTQHHI